MTRDLNITIPKDQYFIYRNRKQVALAEWLRRVPAKYMGFPRESSNLSGDVIFSYLKLLFSRITKEFRGPLTGPIPWPSTGFSP